MLPETAGERRTVAPEVIRPHAICIAIFGRHLSRGVGKATSCLHASFKWRNAAGSHRRMDEMDLNL